MDVWKEFILILLNINVKNLQYNMMYNACSE
jgi:hypothetical protein